MNFLEKAEEILTERNKFEFQRNKLRVILKDMRDATADSWRLTPEGVEYLAKIDAVLVESFKDSHGISIGIADFSRKINRRNIARDDQEYKPLSSGEIYAMHPKYPLY